MSNLLRPTYMAKRVEELADRPELLDGIDLVAFDVDGTLTDHHKTPDDSVKNTLNEIGLGGLGLNLCIISNAYGERVHELRDIFGQFDMPVFTPASVAGEDERVTKHRKPSPAMLHKAAITHGLRTDRVLMVGDQIAKDVVSANKAGAKSLLVPRRGSGDDIKVRLLQRPIEAMARKAMKLEF